MLRMFRICRLAQSKEESCEEELGFKQHRQESGVLHIPSTDCGVDTVRERNGSTDELKQGYICSKSINPLKQSTRLWYMAMRRCEVGIGINRLCCWEMSKTSPRN